MSTKSNPIVHMGLLAGGAWLLYYGISQWVASHYVTTGPSSTTWYIETLGSMLGGAALTFGPSLATALKNLTGLKPDSFLGKLLDKLVLVDNTKPVVPVPVPSPVPKPAPDVSGLDNWMNLLLGQLKPLADRALVGNPEFGLITLLVLGKVARDTHSKALLENLKQTAHAFVEEYFQDGSPKPVPPKPLDPLPVPAVIGPTV